MFGHFAGNQCQPNERFFKQGFPNASPFKGFQKDAKPRPLCLHVSPYLSGYELCNMCLACAIFLRSLQGLQTRCPLVLSHPRPTHNHPPHLIAGPTGPPGSARLTDSRKAMVFCTCEILDWPEPGTRKKKKQEHTHHSPRGFDPGTGEHQPITCKTAQWELGISPPFGHLRSYDRRLHRSRDGQGWQSPEIATDLVPPRQIWPSSPWFGGDISLR